MRQVRQVEQEAVVRCTWVCDIERRHDTDLRDVVGNGIVHCIVVQKEDVVYTISFFDEAQILYVRSVDDGGIVAREEDAYVPIRCIHHVEKSLHDMVRVFGCSARPKPKFEQMVVLYQVGEEFARVGSHVNVQCRMRDRVKVWVVGVERSVHERVVQVKEDDAPWFIHVSAFLLVPNVSKWSFMISMSS